MLNVSSTTAASTTSSTSASSTNSAADMNAAQDRFLKLLVAQLNNQDPMNPVDNAQMTSQMAQINTVTGIQQVNDTLKSMAEQFTAMQVLQGSSMVGHDVLIEGNTLAINNNAASAAFDLAGRAESVKVDVLSPSGQVVDTFNLGALDAGRQAFTWDASSYNFSGSPSFKVTATLGGKAIESTAMVRATVSSVSGDATGMKVQLKGRPDVAYSSVKAIL
ncbi:basal-body rod modification protein FlgD [Rhodoferax lithotrophicus]|uniref:Basal-body rod modification protein FlgD n=1 Tax=Rhodoferax lithotrophicus TaxID=2798804 RepID=A0ABM7MRD8_9BURK|nr:flagellar hook capping FlgD N-terminal domain-containing protein [Rhodoferax sp. MIZ03]BCO28908.1 basal-body rod modification protein FlgD [Rhodoferax sp. MIZ03]